MDSCVISWKASQGQRPSIQADDEKRLDYESIEKLFELQERFTVSLVAVDRLDREISDASDDASRALLIDTLKLCREKFFLTRFKRSTISKAKRATGNSGINLGEGAYWITEDNSRRIDEYIASARNQDEEVDLEMLATVAIAGVRLFVTVDYPLLANNAIREFVKRMDGIHLYRPSEIVKQFGASP